MSRIKPETYGYGAGVRTRDRSSVWARWVIGAACLVLVAVALIGRNAVAAALERNLYNDDERVYLWIDPDTRCQYVHPYRAPLAPRIAADGKSHMGCKGTSP